MPRQPVRVAAALLVLLCLAKPAAAQEALRGVALVIGQSDYETLVPLRNAENDARALDDLLDRLGFDVTRVLNADEDKLRRELADFAEDAASADVALVYYSGHGIEAGGENYLVPIDTDLSSDADELVPFSALLDELSATVPVTIFLLDACRTNPLGDVQLKPPGAAAPVLAAAQGLGVPRGAVLTTQEVGPDALSVVIGFAAWPGQAALDGEGENSPYAAALLKHLGAGGYEFGDLMTMVTQEVYLETATRQVPWVNASLQRFLYFGAPAEAGDPDEELIRQGRRDLLLAIKDTPETTRDLVVAVAGQENVPLDALFGMLQALGIDATAPDANLSEKVEEGARRLRQFLEHSRAEGIRDPESMRLAALVDKAIAEGAIALAEQFGDQLIRRADQFAETLEQARIEVAADYARGASANALAFDFASASEAFGKAYAQVAGIDDTLALKYKREQADALRAHGDNKGDNDALVASIAAYEEAQVLSPRGTDPHLWATLENTRGVSLQLLGERESDPARLEQAVLAYQAVLEIWTRQSAPFEWARTQNNLALALQLLGERESGTTRLEQAVTAYRAALEERTRERSPYHWAMTQNNLGLALDALGERESGTARLKEAVAAYEAALLEWTRDRAPLDWATVQNNLGNTLGTLGTREGNDSRLEAAIVAYRAALQERTRERVPLDWATTQNNLGTVLSSLGLRRNDASLLEGAIAAYRAALQERARERVPLFWATTKNNLGHALWALALRRDSITMLVEAIGCYREALEVRSRDGFPRQWAQTQTNLGIALGDLGIRIADREFLAEGRDAIEAASALYEESGLVQYAEYYTALLARFDAALAELQ